MAVAGMTGTWVGRRRGPVGYTGPAKWGTGINPVHGIPAWGGSRVERPTPIIFPQPPEESYVFPTPEMVYEQFGYTDEDNENQLFAYGYQTGTRSRPDLGSPPEMNRGAIPDQSGVPFPGAPGQTRSGVPGGTGIRTVSRGDIITSTAKEDYQEITSHTYRDASPDMYMKTSEPAPEPPGISDSSQYVVQTSMTQLHKGRNGSQVKGPGRASKYVGGIGPRAFPGMRRTPFSGGYRHSDMLPKEQTFIERIFFPRSAGTGIPSRMQANAQRPRVPYNRLPPEQPDIADAGQNPDLYVRGEHIYGYTPEDILW
jgi:hypothetical protein